MLALAEEGELEGHAFVVKIGNTHRAGVTGDYKRHSTDALKAAFKLEGVLRGPLAPIPDGTQG